MILQAAKRIATLDSIIIKENLGFFRNPWFSFLSALFIRSPYFPQITVPVFPR